MNSKKKENCISVLSNSWHKKESPNEISIGKYRIDPTAFLPTR